MDQKGSSSLSKKSAYKLFQALPGFMNFKVSYQIILGHWKMEQLEFKSTYTVPVQKLGVLQIFEKKDSVCSLNDSSQIAQIL